LQQIRFANQHGIPPEQAHTVNEVKAAEYFKWKNSKAHRMETSLDNKMINELKFSVWGKADPEWAPR